MGFSETEPSIAAVVGSLDAYCARYAAEVLLQGHRVEILQARAWPAARARNPTLNPTLSLQDVLAHATTLDPNSGIRAQSSADRELQRRRAMRIWPAGGTHARPRERAAPAGESRPAREPSLSRGAAPRAGPQGHGEEAAAGVLPRQRQQEARAPGLLPRRRVRGPGARAAARTGAVAQAAVYEEDVLGGGLHLLELALLCRSAKAASVRGCACRTGSKCATGRHRGELPCERPALSMAAPAAPAAAGADPSGAAPRAQFKEVQLVEIPQVAAACKELGDSAGEVYAPPITFGAAPHAPARPGLPGPAPALRCGPRAASWAGQYAGSGALRGGCRPASVAAQRMFASPRCSRLSRAQRAPGRLTAVPAAAVVVQKRHHTRLFATDSRATDRSGNVQPGGPRAGVQACKR